MLHEYELGQYEVIGAGVALLLCLAVPSRWTRRKLWLETWFGRLASKRVASILLVVALALGGRLALRPVLGTPVPSIHDEFSYLLSGDTFASGRLTNPPHPMWVHFETFHVLQQPTYQSKYPPMQGLVLALGERLFGDPWWGVWLSVGLMCGVLTWGLYGWLPPTWALLGGLLSVIRIAWFSYWMNSYWGGAAAAIGGALAFGALGRMSQRRRVGDAVILGLGVAILANSRPYEGFVLSVTIFALLALKVLRAGPESRKQSFVQVFLPLSAILIATFAAMLYYNFRVTGSPLTMPYSVHEKTYAAPPAFVFQSLPPHGTYRHPMLRFFYDGWERNRFAEATSRSTAWYFHSMRYLKLWGFYVGPLLSLSALALWWVLRDRRVRPAAVVVGVTLLAIAPEVWTHAHYAAPATLAFYVLLMQAFRHLRHSRRYPNFAVMPFAFVVMYLFLAALRTGTPPASAAEQEYDTWCCGIERPIPYWKEVNSILGLQPGQQLVFVQYTPEHVVHREWVYNGANLDAAHIVWARAMDRAKDEELLRYYPQRRAWLLEPDLKPPRLVPYRAIGNLPTR